MIIIPPIQITDANLVSSNIVEDLPRSTSSATYNAWDKDTSYTTGNTVCHIFNDDYGGRTPDFGGSIANIYTKGGPYFAIYTAKANNIAKEPSRYDPDTTNGIGPGYAIWTVGAFAPAWNVSKTYAAGAIVGRISGGIGSFYMAKQAHTGQDPATATAYWQQTTVDSYETWDGGDTYDLGDRVVIFTGSIASVYSSLQNSNTNKNPATETDWWEYLGDTFVIWASGATYAAGDVVIDLRTHHEYESAIGSNLGNDPTLGDASKWIDLGKSNRWRMFDTINSSATRYPETIDVTVQMASFVDGLALTGLTATEVQVICTAGGVEVYNQTFDLTDNAQITNWRKYFFDPLRKRAELLVTDLPPYADMLVRVIVSNPGDNAEVGAFTIGKTQELGDTVYGASSGIIDYSRKEVDDFGNYNLIQRAYSKTGQFRVIVAKAQHDSVFNTLTQLRATPAIYIGSGDYASTWIMGFYRRMEAVIEQPEHSAYNLEIEGLT